MRDQVDINATRFMALGNRIRLAILRMLVQGPASGTPAGVIQQQIGIPASTLSHHLTRLAETGLVGVQRDGTTLRYHPNFSTLHGLTDYLWEDCCAGGRVGRNCSGALDCCIDEPVEPRIG